MNQPPETKSLFLGGAAKATAERRSADVPKMGAEAGYEAVAVEDVAPVRISGFIGLFLGVISFAAMVAKPMLVLPALTIGICLLALRKHSGNARPVGTTAAILGLLLASLFGGLGFGIHGMKSSTLGGQATYFAKQYLDLVASGEEAMAIELQKSPSNRQVQSMQLDAVYAEDEAGQEELQNFRGGAYAKVNELGPDIEWELDRRPRVFQKYGIEKVDTYWRDPSGKYNQIIQVEMHWFPNPETGRGEWQVGSFQVEREMLVAPTVL